MTKFVVANVVLIVVLCIGLYIVHQAPAFRPDLHDPGHRPPRDPFAMIMLRDAISIACFVGLSVGLRMVSQWARIETRNKQLEQERAEAELKNLKNQLNPHFLFNTLNNIYALIDVNREKAQNAVLELSRMLRYVLYENKERYVPIEQEISFLQDYIELMRLRQNKQSRIDVHIDIDACRNEQIAPLLFIPLIENAFKHGIDPLRESFIEISLTTPAPHTICCRVSNSYFPKSSEDRSGSGIGLDNIHRQLALLYPHAHTLEITHTENVFNATLTIDLQKTTL